MMPGTSDCGKTGGSEFRELRTAAVFIEALIDANVELGVIIGLLRATSDAADSQWHIPLAFLRCCDSVRAAYSRDVLVKLFAHQVIGAAGVDQEAAARFP